MIKEITVKSILNRHKKRDDWFLDDYSVNPFTGCTFGCKYCYIRGSKYGIDEIAVKINAPEILERQLKRRALKGQYGFIALSSSTEPYQKFEEKLGITRKILEIILKYRFPVHVLTKSTLVLRDIDLLKEINRKAILPEDLRGRLNHGAIINISISTIDDGLSRILEPGAPSPVERFKLVKKLKESGLFTGVSFIPVFPFISDTKEHLDKMIKLAKEHGADFVFVGALTLFGKGPKDSKTLYYKFLENRYPELVRKYKSLYRIFPMPNREYQKNLDHTAREICEKYGVRYKILVD